MGSHENDSTNWAVWLRLGFDLRYCRDDVRWEVGLAQNSKICGISFLA